MVWQRWLDCASIYMVLHPFSHEISTMLKKQRYKPMMLTSCSTFLARTMKRSTDKWTTLVGSPPVWCSLKKLKKGLKRDHKQMSVYEFSSLKAAPMKTVEPITADCLGSKQSITVHHGTLNSISWTSTENCAERHCCSDQRARSRSFVLLLVSYYRKTSESMGM